LGEVLTVQEAADRIGISYWNCGKFVRDGRLKSIRMPRTWDYCIFICDADEFKVKWDERQARKMGRVKELEKSKLDEYLNKIQE